MLRDAALLRGLGRLVVLFAVIFALISAVSLAIGALAHGSLERALADGFYIAGAAVLIGSFVLGIRGPLRPDWGEEPEAEMPVTTSVGLVPRLMPRMIRRATPGERADARRSSLALFAFGLALILIGAGFDPSRHVF